ncbi:hypothetical protein [Streptomyces fuscichromogenes]|uniref:Uncharacterized protein n=1 Tax=Streptomyces fuscichromogenes TaxID=1324013 RepID=A0A917XP96_9ACTN|nr:hypothetical protein [Streptomyces fuscichromogenes]GGN44330.1 hypothetical protein GCM10011578_095170 [Streptomyces fuscichromogenes]
MYRSVVFVHGTGVRGAKFAATLEKVRKGFAEGGALHLDVQGCYWADSHGARLRLGGVSVPGYARTGGGRREAATAREADRWAVLYADPWHELRLLRLGAEAEQADEDAFLEQAEDYRPSPQTAELLRAAELEEYFAQALAALRHSAELAAAATTVGAGGFAHRSAVARGLVAFTVTAARRQDGPDTPAEKRDTLLSFVRGDLDAQDKGGASALLTVTREIASPLAAWYGRRHRGEAEDAATPLAGDILRYQVHGAALREQIADTVAKAPGGAVTLLGHSLGGVACLETMVERGAGKVDQLITVGSQGPYFHEIDALATLPAGHKLPDAFPARWLNVYDPNDFLSYAAEGVFTDRVQDLCVEGGEPFPESHGAYWVSRTFWESVVQWIG